MAIEGNLTKLKAPLDGGPVENTETLVGTVGGLALPPPATMDTNKLRLQMSTDSASGSQIELMGGGGGGAINNIAVTPTPSKDASNIDQSNHIPNSASVDSFSDFSNNKFTMSSPNGPLHVHRDRWYSKRTRRRLVYKNGECNTSHVNISKRRQRYLADIFTTLVDIKWRWNLLIFIMAFTLSWLLFAFIWWLICFSHGDFEHYGQDNWKPCVEEVYDFTSALLFSIETQHTIGYGSRHMNAYCPEAILIMMIQSCFGVIIQALMTGLVFAKLSRPKKRAETLMFSKNAVICKRDGVMCLLFRVGDMRKSHIVEAHVRALMIKKRVTMEGEVMPLYQHEVPIGDEDGESKLFLVWPVILEHRITEGSPFWELGPEDLHREAFELIIIMEGIVESTGMTTQARTSYLPGEILWGHRFERLVTFQKENGEYLIDYSRFNSTIAMDIPQCSAKELAELTSKTMSEEEYDDDDDSSLASGSSNKDKDKPLTVPLIMKQCNTTQTANMIDDDDDDDDSRQFEMESDMYNYMCNHI